MSLCLCLFVGAALFFLRSNFPARYFFLFLSINSLSSVFQWLMTHPSTSYKSFWLMGIMALALFVAPCLWMFADDLNAKHSKKKSLIQWRHLMPIALGVALLLPLASSIHAGSRFYNEVEPLAESYTFFIHSTMLLMVGVFIIQSIYYLRQCTAFVGLRLNENRNLFAESSDPGLNALRVLTLVVIANVVVNVMRVLYCWVLDDISIINLTFAFIQFSLTAYLCFSVVMHAINYNPKNQAIRQTLFKKNDSFEIENSSLQQPKYQHSSLSNQRRSEILANIQELFDQGKCYQDNRLNLDLLCKQLGELPYIVSQVINESQHVNFHTLVNTYRIAEARVLLHQNMERPVLEIAYDVGYNSKSTFNTAFKKLVGCSPSVYRKRNSTSSATSRHRV